MTSVLIVDDSPVIRKVARCIFEQLGFSVQDVENGKQAMESCQAAMPDLILLDWNMPILDGFGFVRALRLMPEGRFPKVLFCTAENDVGHIARAMHAGADDFILKPFDDDIIRAKLETLGVLAPSMAAMVA